MQHVGIGRIAGALLAAVNAADVAGILACWAPDGVLCPPHHPAVRGHVEIERYFRGVFAARRLTFQFTDAQLGVSGDLAVERIHYESLAVSLSGGADRRDVGKGIHVYRRAADGEWRLAQDIWNSDLA